MSKAILMRGGGVSLNIAYGDVPPVDTSMLWLKCAEPTAVRASKNLLSYAATGEETDRNLATAYGYIENAAFALGNMIYIPCYYGRDIYMYEYNTRTNSIGTKVTGAYGSVGDIRAFAMVGHVIYSFVPGSNEVKGYHVFDEEVSTIPIVGTNGLSRFDPTSPIDAVAIGTRVYIFGRSLEQYYSAAIACYDTETHTCEFVGLTSNQYYRAARVAVGDKIYSFGGMTYIDDSLVNYITCFDATTGVSERLPTALPTAYADANACAIGSLIYVVHGYPSIEHLCYDTMLGTIATANTGLYETRNATAAVAVGNDIYAIYDDIKHFRVTRPLDAGTVYLVLSLNDSLFNIVNEDDVVEVGLVAAYIGDTESNAVEVEAYLYNADTSSWEPVTIGTATIMTTAVLGAAVLGAMVL